MPDKAMCVERLRFHPGAMDYHAQHAAEHRSCGDFAVPVSAGKRVLDVASRGAELLTSDALDLPAVLGNRAPFVVTVTFASIEHLSDPRRFLDGIWRLLAPRGIILLSCPKDALERARAITNPFHLRTYMFDQFLESTTSVLGPVRWYLGTPLQGIAIAEASFSLLRNDICVKQREERLNEHVAFLEEQIGELRRASRLEKQREERLNEHVAFLEEQIGELRRASRLEKARHIPQHVHEAVLRLGEIESSRGYRLLRRYHALASAPVTRPIVGFLRGFALRVMRLARRLGFAS
jgi:SAM-dependent methyltransferase